jgi:hypothetical protein
MARDDFLAYIINRFTLEQRLFAVSLNVGGDPPDIQWVRHAFGGIERDLNLAWLLAETLPYASDREQAQPLWARDILDRLNKLGPEPYNAIDEFRSGFLNDEGRNPRPIAQVLGAEHENPLETVILVTAASIVMLVTGTMWAARQYLRFRPERQLIEAQAEILETISEAITRGDTKTLNAVRPIALGIIHGAQKSILENEALDIKIMPGMSFGVGNPSSKISQSRKRTS